MPALAQVTLNRTTGLGEDAIVNTIAIRTEPAWTAVDAGAWALLIADFYNASPGFSASKVADFLNQTVSRTVLDHTINIYELDGHLDGSPHGSPVTSTPFTLATGLAQDPYPGEVAGVLTLEAEGRTEAAVEAPDGADADFLPDRPKQRHTGRIYIGPLVRVASSIEAVTNLPRPSSDFIGTCIEAMLALDDAIAAQTNGVGVGVWSRKDAVMRPLAAVSMDNAWDTMRSRGVDPTARTRSVA